MSYNTAGDVVPSPKPLRSAPRSKKSPAPASKALKLPSMTGLKRKK